MKKHSEILNLLGICFRAGKLYLGETNLARFSSLHFVFISSDASDKTKERYLKKCSFYQTDSCLEFHSSELSAAIGKNNVKIIGINDKGFADKIRLLLKKEDEDGKTNV